MKKLEEIKKGLIISAAVLAIFWSTSVIIHNMPIGYRPIADIEDIINIIGAIVTIPISILIVFNIKLPKALRIPLVVVSILVALSYLAILFRLLFSPDIPLFSYLHGLTSIIFIIVYVPAIIILLTYIRRSLKPASQPADK